MKNLYQDEKYAAQVSQMKNQLEGLRRKYDDNTVGTLKPEAWRQKHRTLQFRVKDEL